jgi:hypothetical protein
MVPRGVVGAGGLSGRTPRERQVRGQDAAGGAEPMPHAWRRRELRDVQRIPVGFVRVAAGSEPRGDVAGGVGGLEVIVTRNGLGDSWTLAFWLAVMDATFWCERKLKRIYLFAVKKAGEATDWGDP